MGCGAPLDAAGGGEAKRGGTDRRCRPSVTLLAGSGCDQCDSMDVTGTTGVVKTAASKVAVMRVSRRIDRLGREERAM